METSTHRKYEHVGPIKEGKMVNIDMLESNQTTDIHIKNLPVFAWRVAKSAATLEGTSIAMWVAKAILEKWERQDKHNG
jgi:hypothetical protein